MSPLQPPAWSIWQPQTCPRGLQAAPFLPDRRGWGDPSRGRAVPSPQLPNSPPDPLDLPPPSTPDGSGLPNPLLILIPLGLKQTKLPPQEPLFGGGGCIFFNDTPVPHLFLPFPMLPTSYCNSDSVLVCLVLCINGMLLR